MQNDLPVYELYAIRYAMRDAKRSEHFIGGDPHDGPMPMDYFVWLARCGEHNVVIDTGFTEAVATRRGRQFLHCPIDTMAALGVAADAVQDVILTHLHYDHSGHFDRFANARFHLQEKELHFATGKYMRHPRMSYSFEVDDVCGIVRMNYKQRLMFYDGDDELCPGIRLHRTGGQKPVATSSIPHISMKKSMRRFGRGKGCVRHSLCASSSAADLVIWITAALLAA